MKKYITLLFAVCLIAGCKKSDTAEVKTYTALSIIQINRDYRVQQYQQVSTNPVKWDYVDMSGPIYVSFNSESKVTEKRGTTVFNGNYTSKGTVETSVSVNFDLPSYTPTGVSALIIATKQDCKLYKESNDILLSKPLSSLYFEQFRLVP